MANYIVGQSYDRGDLHATAAAAGLRPGNRTAGIVQLGLQLTIFWNPYRRFYANRWVDGTTEFVYSGEGTAGNMLLETMGNRRLLAAESDGSTVCLFLKSQATGSHWTFIGEYQVVDHHEGWSRDATGGLRTDLRFHLRRSSETQPALDEQALPALPPGEPPSLPSEEELWAVIADRIASTGAKRRRGTHTHRDKRESDALKTEYVLTRSRRFGGTCELCAQRPAWVTPSGLPHYQAHHIDPDIDLVDWIGALCGTCHDRMHHSADRAEAAIRLRRIVRQRQLDLGRPVYEKGDLPLGAS